MGTTPSSTRALSPGDVLRLLLRRWRSVLFFAALCAGAAFGLALIQRPKFEASATILLDSSARGGLLGNLSMLGPIAGGVAATGEVAVIRSRGVAEKTVRNDAGRAAPVPGSPGYVRHVGLTTMVSDESLRGWTLLRNRFAGDGDGRPAVQASYRLFAHAERVQPEAPTRVRVAFLDGNRVRVETHGLAQRLGLGERAPEEFAFAPGEPIAYRGLELWLEPRGPVAGRVFRVESVPEYEAVERLLDRYWAAETTRNSGVIRLTVEDTDPFRAAETANAIAENYLRETHARNEHRSSYTIAYIQSLVEESRATVEKAQEELLRIRGEHPETIDVDATGKALIEQISQLEIQRTQLDLRARAMAEILKALEEGDTLALSRLDSAVTGGLVVDPITEGYLEKLAELNASYAELGQRFEADHPQMQTVRGSAEEIIGLIREQLESRLDGVRLQGEELARSRDARLEELASLPEDMLAVAEPMLILHTQQELMPELMRNMKATEIANSASSFTAQTLDRARPATEAAAPKFGPIVAVGTVLGLLLGLFVALVRDPVSGRVVTTDDLEDVVQRPVVGTVPLARAKASAGDETATVDAVRSLRAAIKNLRPKGSPVRLLGVTSVASEAGRPRVTAALARSFAREGARVALVEADLRAPRVAPLVGVEAKAGLSEALDADGATRDALVDTDTPGLVLLPAGRPDDASGDLLSGARFDALLADLSSERDLVLLDLPTAVDSPDVEAVAPKLDGLLIACERGACRRADLRGARERIERAGGRVVGSVLVTRGSRA